MRKVIIIFLSFRCFWKFNRIWRMLIGSNHTSSFNLHKETRMKTIEKYDIETSWMKIKIKVFWVLPVFKWRGKKHKFVENDHEYYSGRILICTEITIRVPPHQDCPKQMTRHASRSLSQAPLSHSRGYSSFRGHCRPENSHTPTTFLSTTQLFLSLLHLLRVRHLQ